MVVGAVLLLALLVWWGPALLHLVTLGMVFNLFPTVAGIAAVLQPAAIFVGLCVFFG
jgi:hypothetical protein